MRGATEMIDQIKDKLKVSIHAPHAGRDQIDRRIRTLIKRVSIHAPHAGRDYQAHGRVGYRYVSIHAPHAGRDSSDEFVAGEFKVSIHAPHAGRDQKTGWQF